MTLTSQLHTLEFSGLIGLAHAQPELEYLFRHSLVQEAAYGSLVRQDRRHLHLAAGEALERLYGGRLEELAPLLGRHFSEAGDDERALKYFTLAGDAAARVYANGEAAMHYNYALEIARRVRPEAGSPPDQSPGRTDQLTYLFTRRGRTLELNSQYDQALQNYVEMEALAGERGDRRLELAALMAHATIRSVPTHTFDQAQGQALSDRALVLARKLGDREAEAKILWNLVRLYSFIGQVRQAVEYGEQSLALARALNLREQVAFTLNDICVRYVNLGQMPRAQTAAQEARELWRELGNLPMLTDSLATSASIACMAGEYEQAIAMAAEGYEISKSIDNLWGQAYNRGMAASAQLELGQLSAALSGITEGISLAERTDFSSGLVVLRTVQARLYRTLGALEQGIEVARLALATAEAKIPIFFTWAMAVLAEIHLRQGNLPAATAAVQQSTAGLEPENLVSMILYAAPLAEAELALARQDHARALTVMDEYIANLRKFGMRLYLSEALLIKGQALLAQGRVEEARTTLAEGRAIAEAIGARRSLWPILKALGQIEAQRGNQAEAQALRQKAREIIEYIADHAPPEMRETFLNLPEVRNLSVNEYGTNNRLRVCHKGV